MPMSHRELWDKGDRLIFQIAIEYSSNGYFVIPNYGHSLGVDLMVIANPSGTIKAVIECKNYARKNYVCEATFKKDIDSLNIFSRLPNIEKIMVVSYSEILSDEQKEKLRQSNIKLRVMGYEA